jgi:hypothetical protein
MTILTVFTSIDFSHIKTAVSTNCQQHFLYHSARRFDPGKQATEISIAEQNKKFQFFKNKMDKCVCVRTRVCAQPFQPLKQLIDFHGLRKSKMPLETQHRHATECTTMNN